MGRGFLGRASPWPGQAPGQAAGAELLAGLHMG